MDMSEVGEVVARNAKQKRHCIECECLEVTNTIPAWGHSAERKLIATEVVLASFTRIADLQAFKAAEEWGPDHLRDPLDNALVHDGNL